MNKIIFLNGSFISQFSILTTIFKCYKVYWSTDQERVYHETESLTVLVSHD
jgi:hypothetical protein